MAVNPFSWLAAMFSTLFAPVGDAPADGPEQTAPPAPTHQAAAKATLDGFLGVPWGSFGIDAIEAFKSRFPFQERKSSEVRMIFGGGTYLKEKVASLTGYNCDEGFARATLIFAKEPDPSAQFRRLRDALIAQHGKPAKDAAADAPPLTGKFTPAEQAAISSGKKVCQVVWESPDPYAYLTKAPHRAQLTLGKNLLVTLTYESGELTERFKKQIETEHRLH